MLLALDTTTLQSSAALVDAEGLVVAARRATVTTHSEQLLALVDGVLADAGLGPGELRAVACGAGPGSFTGLRIGLSTAKGLCLALERPLLLVSSLAAIALRAEPGQVVVATIDAFKGEVYAGAFRRGEERRAPLEALGPEEVLAPERLLERMAALGPLAGLRLLGNAADRWPVLLAPGLEAGDRRPPDAAEVGRLGRLRLDAGEEDDLAAAVPRYIRPSEAEIHFGRNDS